MVTKGLRKCYSRFDWCQGANIPSASQEAKHYRWRKWQRWSPEAGGVSIACLNYHYTERWLFFNWVRCVGLTDCGTPLELALGQAWLAWISLNGLGQLKLEGLDQLSQEEGWVLGLHQSGSRDFRAAGAAMLPQKGGRGLLVCGRWLPQRGKGRSHSGHSCSLGELTGAHSWLAEVCWPVCILILQTTILKWNDVLVIESATG